MGVCDPLYPPGSYDFFITLLWTLVCILGAAAAAGLTMGLISLDALELAVLLESKDDDCRTDAEKKELAVQQEYAARVLPLVSRHHQLLVTLLLLNSLANESLPLFLDSLVPSWLAIVLSVTALLIFAEILPSAIFTGPSGLRISAQMAPLVSMAMILASPVALPISWVLDRFLGTHDFETSQRYNKSQLLALLRLHTDDTLPSPDGSEVDEEDGTMHGASRRRGLARNEVRMMHGAMSMHDVRVADVMTKADDIFMLDYDNTKLGLATLANLVYQGHSRIPVYKGDRNHICGILLTKKLIALSPADERSLSSLTLRPPLFVHSKTTLSAVLREMKSSKSHMAVVVSHPIEMAAEARGGPPFPEGVTLGCITLLDVVQRLVDERLDDEDTPSPYRTLTKHGSASADDGSRISLLAAGRLRAWAQRAKLRFGERSMRSSGLASSLSSATGAMQQVEEDEDAHYVRLDQDDQERDTGNHLFL